jgi:restriction system protein
MTRRSQSTIEDVIDITAKFPWWLGVTLAVFTYALLHFYATREVPVAVGTPELGKVMGAGLLHTFALFGQYILPFAFFLGAFISAINRFKREKIYENTLSSKADNPLVNISWHEFELLVGEYFRRQGYSVEETEGGADGGVDLIITRNGEKHLVQCKQWKAYKVGVKIVRELLGVMVGSGATGGFVITSGDFTKDAVSFARANNIELLDGKVLKQMLKLYPRQTSRVTVKKSIDPTSAPELSSHEHHGKNQPLCPKCGSEMVQRVAKQGKRPGEKFWGCSKFPACRSVLPIE